MLKIFLGLYVLCGFCSSYKILVAFTYPRPSHGILGERFVRCLLSAGHQITYISPIPIKRHARLRQVDLSSIYDPNVIAKNFNFTNFIGKETTFHPPRHTVLFIPANQTIFHPNFQKLIHDPKQQFDLVVAEWMFVDLVGSGLAAVFNCPLIWVASMEPINPYLFLLQSSMNPAYTISSVPKEDPPFTFWRRMVELYEFCMYNVHLWLHRDSDEDLYKRAFGSAAALRRRALPSYQEVRYNASLILGNSFVSTDIAVTLPPNYKQIGGYHIEDNVPPLPKDLQKIMDESQHGVIYFSLGSILDTKGTPDKLKKSVMEAFAGLKQTVIWKFEANASDIPPNVHLMKWTPQQSILAHKSCILFITHGGQLSLTEAIHFGVPVIGIPLFADQHINVKRTVKKGFGKAVTLSTDLGKDLKVAIEDIIGNTSYMEKATEYSHIHRKRLVPPGKELVYWVEHVIETRGAPHLRSPASVVPLYQKMYLDWMLVIIVSCYAMMKAIKYLFKYNITVRKLKHE